MTALGAAVVVVVLVALIFAWTNGFHDASNSVATSLATGALTPQVALGLAALLNVVGGLFGVSIAQTVRRSLLDVPMDQLGVSLITAALAAAIAWNVVTWRLGLPSSSSQALFGGLAGASLTAGIPVSWGAIGHDVLLPMVVSPVLGFGAAWVLTAVLLRVVGDAAHAVAMRRFRLAQTVSAAAMALGHGLQDAQKTTAVMLVALVASGEAQGEDGVPLWARVAVAVALGAGTAFGGWRIIRSLGRRIAPIDPLTGFAAEAVAAGALYTAAGAFAAPVSSTHVLVASIMGGGATRGLRSIRWRHVRWIVLAFVVTPLATGLLAAALCHLTPQLTPPL
ncbi:MAG TPA: inorganic phosphate transporter [Kineosporiaceae bacterium]